VIQAARHAESVGEPTVMAGSGVEVFRNLGAVKLLERFDSDWSG
jgi:hypothetical protein